VASLSQGRTAAAQCGLFTHKSVPVIFEPPCIIEKKLFFLILNWNGVEGRAYGIYNGSVLSFPWEWGKLRNAL